MHFPWRTNLWFIPSLTVTAALAVFALSQRVDWLNHTGQLMLPAWLDQGSAADARSLLAATAGAIITTLGLVLSITVVTLSIAASQFGQRLLRRYLRDRGTQVCIGIFAATFVFSLLTLLSVTSHTGEKEYVPWLSIWISTLWALTCICVLIYYINHVGQNIQVNNVLAQLSAEFQWALRQGQPQRDLSGIFIPEVRADLCLTAPVSGYIQAIDYGALVKAAADVDATLRFLFRPGQFVFQGAAIAQVEVGRPAKDELQEAFERSVRIGTRRTLPRDPEFATAQIVEIALRAMSPGMNDPNTAITCVDWLADALRALAQYPSGPSVHVDRGGLVRVIEKPHGFDCVVTAAYDPIRQVARNSPMLTTRLMRSISEIAPFLQTTAQRLALREQVALAFEGFNPDAVSRDREEVAAAYQCAVEGLQTSDLPKWTSVVEPQHS